MARGAVCVGYKSRGVMGVKKNQSCGNRGGGGGESAREGSNGGKSHAGLGEVLILISFYSPPPKIFPNFYVFSDGYFG